MKVRCWMVFVALAGCLLGGCVSPNEASFEKRVQHWVPLGTTVAKAQRIMEHHGFECSLIKEGTLFNQRGSDYLDCTREQVWFHDWNARLIVEDGKITGYGPISVGE